MIPSLFIGHGSPMIAIEKSEYGDFLDKLGSKLDKPSAIVIFSPHWESRIQKVSEVEEYSTIYDLAGCQMRCTTSNIQPRETGRCRERFIAC